MKNVLLSFLAIIICYSAKATGKDSTVNYNLADSIKAVQFFAEINVQTTTTKNKVYAGIKTDIVKLSLEADKEKKEIVFEFPDSAKVLVTGLHIDAGEKGKIEFKYNWNLNETYKLMIAVATDSAENYSVYSGYVLLPKENKWKLIGTCKISGRWNTIQQPASFFSTGKNGMQISTSQVWIQRNNGSWKNLKEDGLVSPVVNLFGHIDSTEQRQIDMQLIGEAIATGNTDAKNNKEGVYYTMIKEGTGKQVSLNDTVTVNYRLNLFNDTAVIQQTTDKPATFPLKRLIKGWQIGVPLCRVGGKIKLVIPSDLAYSIRTRAANIPPNSILVFEIEILDAKSPL